MRLGPGSRCRRHRAAPAAGPQALGRTDRTRSPATSATSSPDPANANGPRNTIHAYRGDLIAFAAHHDGEIAGLTEAPVGAVLSLSVTRPLEFSQCGPCLNWLPGSYPTPACGQQARMLDLDACGGSWSRFGKLNVRHGKGSGRRGTQAAADAADQGR